MVIILLLLIIVIASVLLSHYEDNTVAPIVGGLAGGTVGDNANATQSRPLRARPIEFNRQMINIIGASKSNLSIMTQNVLADSFALPSFRHSPPWVISWDNRKVKLAKEYATHMPDIICLQELDKCDDLLNETNKQMKIAFKAHSNKSDEKPAVEPKYSAVYAQRGGDFVDGCGIYYNNTVELVEYRIIDYNKGTMMDTKDKMNNVAIIAQFKKDNKLFIVATLHHYWDPKLLDLKHKQVDYLLFELSKETAVYPKAPIFVCGDFNFSPTGRDISIPITYSPYDKMIAKFNSSYREILGDEPEFTTLYKRGARHYHEAKVPPRSAWTLDYIFYKNATVLGVLEIPTVEKTTKNNWRGIPNAIYGSDHFSLKSDFKI